MAKLRTPKLHTTAVIQPMRSKVWSGNKVDISHRQESGRCLSHHLGADGESVFRMVSLVVCRSFEANVSVLTAKYRCAGGFKLYLLLTYLLHGAESFLRS